MFTQPQSGLWHTNFTCDRALSKRLKEFQVFVIMLISSMLTDAYMRRQTNHHWFKQWLAARTAPIYYLNQCSNVLIGTSGTNFSQISIEIQTFSLKKIQWKMLHAKCGPIHLGLSVLINLCRIMQLSSELVITVRAKYHIFHILTGEDNSTYIVNSGPLELSAR